MTDSVSMGRASNAVRALWLLCAGTTWGCGADGPEPTASLEGNLVITSDCTVSGSARLANGDVSGGNITGNDTDPPVLSGQWAHFSGSNVMLGTPDFLLCRINGATIGIINGPATWNGEPGYTFETTVHDIAGAVTPPPTGTSPDGCSTLTASLSDTGVATDGELAISGPARVILPRSLSSSARPANGGLATLTFLRVATQDLVTCDYAGRGSKYRFSGCSDASLSDGDAVDVALLRLHVARGRQGCGDHGTEVSACIDATPLTAEATRDTIRVQVLDSESAVVFDVEDRLASGDYVVELHP